MGGSPFPEGNDHGGADEEFASVVLDEDFIRSARIHEPTAQERMLAAAQARAEEHGRARVGAHDDELAPDVDDEDGYYEGRRDDYGPDWDEDDRDESLPPGYRRAGHTRWHRTVAWVLAVVMGLGVVALTVGAVYRGASSGGRQQPTPTLPGNSRIEGPAEPADPADVPAKDPVAPRP